MKLKNHRQKEKYEGVGKEGLHVGDKVGTLASVDKSIIMAVEESLLGIGLDVRVLNSTSEC